MKALVAAATRHGATAEIASAIANRLTEHGVDAVVHDPEDVRDLTGFDAFVVGSAVYMGNWLEAATSLVDRVAQERGTRPVWLFSSGPLGDPPKPEGDPAGLSELVEATDAREHRVFSGKLDKAKLGLGERAVVKMVRAPAGDQRDWNDVAEWSAQIADALQTADPVA